MPPRLTHLDHLVITVADLDATLTFYANILGMRPEPFLPAGGPPRWALHFGAQKINIHVAGKELEPKAKAPTPGSADLCFVSDTPLQAWQVHLDALGVAVEDGPVARTGATGPLFSLYIRDPDGTLIEISNPA